MEDNYDTNLTGCEEVRALHDRQCALNRLEQMTILFMTKPTPTLTHDTHRFPERWTHTFVHTCIYIQRQTNMQGLCEGLPISARRLSPLSLCSRLQPCGGEQQQPVGSNSWLNPREADQRTVKEQSHRREELGPVCAGIMAVFILKASVQPHPASDDLGFRFV